MELTLTTLLVLVVIGAGTGVLGALLGTGGGVFLIPLLIIVFHVPAHYAIGTSLLAVIATSTAVASANVERGTANLRLGMTLEIATSLGAIGGGLMAGLLSPRVLETVFALVLIPTAVLMWRNSREVNDDIVKRDGHDRFTPTDVAEIRVSADDTGVLGGRYLDAGREIVYRFRRPWAGLAISFVAGNLSGLLGIGGGVFKVPALNLICAVPIKAAAATSNFMIGVTAAASAFLYFGRGEVRPGLTAGVVLGVVTGSAIGSAVSQRVGGHFLKRLFAVLLLGVVVEMLARVYLSTG